VVELRARPREHFRSPCRPPVRFRRRSPSTSNRHKQTDEPEHKEHMQFQTLSARAAIATAPWKTAPWKLAVVNGKKKKLQQKFKKHAKEQYENFEEEEKEKEDKVHEAPVVQQRPQPSSAPYQRPESAGETGGLATVPLAIPELLRAVAQLMDGKTSLQ